MNNHSSPVLTNVKVIANTPATGGGLYCDWYTDPTITNVDIKSNINKNIPSYFIGTIEKNNYDTADFKFKANSKPGIYPVTIIIHYKDSNLKDKNKQKYN